MRRLELAVSALVRWIESRPIRARIAQRAGVELGSSAVGLLEHLQTAGPMRVSDIAECHAVDTSTATVRVQSLQRDGLVDRTADPDDGRVSMIAISPGGRAAVERLRAARRELLREVFGDAEVEDLEHAAALIGRIEQRILAAVGAAAH